MFVNRSYRSCVTGRKLEVVSYVRHALVNSPPDDVNFWNLLHLWSNWLVRLPWTCLCQRKPKSSTIAADKPHSIVSALWAQAVASAHIYVHIIISDTLYCAWRDQEISVRYSRSLQILSHNTWFLGPAESTIQWWLAAWCIVASVVRRMNEVTIRRARLVLGWVTVFGRVYHHGM